MLEAGYGNFSGFAFDPCLDERHQELRETAREHGSEVILDPKSVELSTEGGIRRSGIGTLPWTLGEELPHSPAQVRANIIPYAEALAEHATGKSYSAVLAPTHFVSDSRDEWLEIDASLTYALRKALYSAGGKDIPIYYPLVVSGQALRSWTERRRFKSHLEALPIDALWLRVHAFGTTTSGPRALPGYIEAGRDFHTLGLPIVAERVGGVGLALMAFGAVGGIESGLTFGERYDHQSLRRKPKDGDGFLQPPRVYIAELGAFLKAKQAAEFFEIRGMKSKFGCRDTDCCRRGTEDMLRDPRGHFLRRRGGEISSMSRLPAEMRAPNYLDEFLRPATDLALTASRVYPRFNRTQAQLEQRRITLSAMQRTKPAESFAQTPRGQRVIRKSA